VSQLHIAAACPVPDREPGRRRVLATGRTRGGSALIQTKARRGDITTTGRRPDAADFESLDALAADLAAALAERQAAEPVARAGRAAWQQRDEAAS